MMCDCSIESELTLRSVTCDSFTTTSTVIKLQFKIHVLLVISFQISTVTSIFLSLFSFCDRPASSYIFQNEHAASNYVPCVNILFFIPLKHAPSFEQASSSSTYKPVYSSKCIFHVIEIELIIRNMYI